MNHRNYEGIIQEYIGEKKYLPAKLLFLSIFLFLGSTYLFSSQSPLQMVKKSNQGILNIFIFNKTIDKETESQILKIIKNSINIPVISSRIIHKFCKKMVRPQCERLDKVFQKFLYISILKNLRKHHAVHFKYLKEKIEQEKAIVTAVGYYKSETADIEYHLEIFGKRWFIINSIVDDVDMIGNYQKQFDKLFLRYSPEKIISRFLKKISQYEKKYGK